MALSRRNLIGLLVADVVIFVLSNVVVKNSSDPGIASNILWVIFLIGFVALIVLSVLALTQSRRGAAAK
jgi:hypothetical protein